MLNNILAQLAAAGPRDTVAWLIFAPRRFGKTHLLKELGTRWLQQKTGKSLAVITDTPATYDRNYGKTDIPAFLGEYEDVVLANDVDLILDMNVLEYADETGVHFVGTTSDEDYFRAAKARHPQMEFAEISK